MEHKDINVGMRVRIVDTDVVPYVITVPGTEWTVIRIYGKSAMLNHGTIFNEDLVRENTDLAYVQKNLESKSRAGYEVLIQYLSPAHTELPVFECMFLRSVLQEKNPDGFFGMADSIIPSEIKLFRADNGKIKIKDNNSVNYYYPSDPTVLGMFKSWAANGTPIGIFHMSTDKIDYPELALVFIQSVSEDSFSFHGKVYGIDTSGRIYSSGSEYENLKYKIASAIPVNHYLSPIVRIHEQPVFENKIIKD